MNQHLVDKVLETMGQEGRTHFSPHYVCQRAGESDLRAVTEHMFFLVGYRLKVYYEVECPEGDSDFVVNDPREIIKEIRQCSICGTEYIPSEDRIWVAFDFLPDYVNEVKKKRLYPPNGIIPKNPSLMLRV